MNKRFVITNIELIKEYEQKEKHHAFSLPLCKLEWLITLNQKIGYHGVGVYKKLSNKYFDKLIRDIRSKYNTELVNTSKTIPYRPKSKQGILSIYGLPSDQSQRQIGFSLNFMGIEVPVHTGPEMLKKI
jgi:KDO2-lipid IV(A) lauroyltransferase